MTARTALLCAARSGSAAQTGCEVGSGASACRATFAPHGSTALCCGQGESTPLHASTFVVNRAAQRGRGREPVNHDERGSITPVRDFAAGEQAPTSRRNGPGRCSTYLARMNDGATWTRAPQRRHRHPRLDRAADGHFASWDDRVRARRRFHDKGDAHRAGVSRCVTLRWASSASR